MADAALDVLLRVPFFEDLDPAELQGLADSMEKCSFAAGQIVIAEGAGADGFFVVESGEAEVIVQGQRQGTIKPGDCFGEIALLTGSERTATVKATSDLHCYGLKPSDFRAVIEDNPSIAWRVFESMAHWRS